MGPLEGKSKYVDSYHKLAGIGTCGNNDCTYKTTIKPIKFHLECMPEERNPPHYKYRLMWMCEITFVFLHCRVNVINPIN